MAFDRLIENIVKMQNPTVAGLDPKLDYVPESIKTKCFEKYGKTLEGAAAALFEFNKALIDALYDIVPAVKPHADVDFRRGLSGAVRLVECGQLVAAIHNAANANPGSDVRAD